LPSEMSGEVILGIDPGSLRTGFGIIAHINGGITHIAHGTIVLNHHQEISYRLRDLASDLSSLIDKYGPTRAAVEDVFLFKNPRSALVLGQARGAVLAVLGLRGLSIQTFTPTKVKSLVCGQGRAKKFQVAQLVAHELGIPIPRGEDASDALALAIAYVHTLSQTSRFL
jgi:crossover junction endodeoxyribonuclease RuvC